MLDVCVCVCVCVCVHVCVCVCKGVEKCCAWLLECFMFVYIVDSMKEEGEKGCGMNSCNHMF